MKPTGDLELSDVPRLLQRAERGDPGGWLGARAALTDAAGELMGTAVAENRALKPDEQRRFDACMAQAAGISADMAEYKRKRIADIVAQGLPAEYCRLPW
jgi:hypothetical protein